MDKKIAITGFSFRLPGTDEGRYWQDLLDGRNLITKVASDRWSQESLLHPNKQHPGSSYTFAAGSLGDISKFDAGFFGISPREASQMDPQQRLLLEMCWEALENSGIRPSSLRGSQCGAFIGISSADYSYRLADDLSAIDSSVATGNTSSVAANRISYFFDLRGPSMAIDTACSSSLVAFHQACRSILSGECVQSFAGGISLHLHPYGFIIFSKASMLSPRGKCSVFDASGDGYVRSEGGGVIFLKDYDQAIADGNPVLAVVANSSINMDGRKSGLTVPNPKAQEALLKQAYNQAGIDPEDIDYIEAHGTGTAVGDPIETEAIGAALGKRRSSDNPLPIGSVKSNLGHLETASGMAGLVKALYCIRHREIPATIGITTQNPNIDLDVLNLSVVTKNLPLKKTGKVIIGINSFGFGGANAHVILESHDQSERETAQPPRDILLPFMLSAKTGAALKATAQDFSDFLLQHHQKKLYDIAYNSFFLREKHDHRLIIHGNNIIDIAKELDNFVNDVPTALVLETGTALKAPHGPSFMYSGNGSQWHGMGKQLLEENQIFRETVEEIDTIFQRHSDFSLIDLLTENNNEDRYEYTEIAQPALFTIQVGITQMLKHRGLTPVAVAGHSVGEVAAAWAAGALTLEDAVLVIYHRSRLQGKTKGKGGMTAISLGLKAASELLTELNLADTLTVAGVNSSRGVTIAGNPSDLARLEATLDNRKIFQKRLAIDYAFHSQSMDEIKTSLQESLKTIRPRQTLIPYYSTVTGNLISGEELHGEYWWNNIRKPVLFERATANIIAAGTNIFIEVGPHTVLRSYINTCLKDQNTEGRIISTAKHGNNSSRRVWKAYSQAILLGAEVDWKSVFPTPGRFIQLPNYPWQKERHWHAVTPDSMGLLNRTKIHPLLGYSLKQQELVWENQLDLELNPTLADHTVGDATVFPGAGFSELVLAAAVAWQQGELVEIEDLEIRTFLQLHSDQTKLVRCAIDDKDGSVTIKAKDHGTNDPWTLHAVARILTDPRDILLRQVSPVLPNRNPDFTGSSHALLTRKADLDYGPAFQCIDYGWVENESVLTVFQIPASIETELEQSHLHPALLDCTFQLIIQALKKSAGPLSKATFVPVRIGRIAFRRTPDKPAFAQATLLRITPHSLTADFSIFDNAGEAIAVIKDVRFRSVRLSKKSADLLRFLDYHAVPRPHALAPEGKSLISFKKIRASFNELSRSAEILRSLHRYSDEIDPLLDILCTQFIRETLQQLSSDGQNLFPQDIDVYKKARPELEPYLDYLLSLAKEDQIISATPGGWVIQPTDNDLTSAQDIWHSLITDYPGYFDIVHSVGRVGMHLKSILDGSRSSSEISMGDVSFSKLLSRVIGTIGRQKIGQALQEIIAQGLRQLPEGQRFGILEISKGTPSFAEYACQAMEARCCDYVFASVSNDTITATQQLQDRFPCIETRLISDTSGQLDQIIPCQLAVVTIDFNNAEETMAALRYARSCLTSGGALIVIGFQPARWIDFVFGSAREHWSLSENGSLLSNQCTASFWKQQLQQLKFSDSNIFELSQDSSSGPYLLVAEKTNTVLSSVPARKTIPKIWILLADEQGFSSTLADTLTNILQIKGDIVIQGTPKNTAAIESLLIETTSSYSQIDGIVHLAGLSTQSVNTDGATILDQQLFRCGTAANIIQALEKSETSTTCWLVTINAATDMLPNRSAAGDENFVILPKDAALWGFGRTLMNEATNYSVRLVDLEAPATIENCAVALAREFEQPDIEQEIILTQSGERFAPRLYIQPRFDKKIEENSTKETAPPSLSLGFQFSGQLNSLRWESSTLTAPAADEVEVEVQATGLNFRDIMYTLGMLPDEAIENGFTGPHLGLEFSGIIKSVGSETYLFAPGDEVVGFGPSSFSTRLITKASAISHIPPGISFEAAATIPSTFFTAYYSLHYLARLQPGEKVLIHGAAGGVGLAAIQIAQWIGAEIYVTAGSDEKRDFLRLLGIDNIYHSRSLSFADEILAQTDGQGVDVVLNSLAGEAINRNLRVLKPFGRFLELGKRDFYENTKIGLRPFRNNISYFGIDADQLMQAHPELTRRLFAEVMALFTKGFFHPLPYHVFEAENVVAAFRYMQQARQIGKIVVTYANVKGISYIQRASSTESEKLVLKSHATYLVTGGLGGFGLRTAEWLADKGARNLVLLSRSGPGSEESITSIEGLEKRGVKVHAASCDVTDKQALADVLAEIATKLPPLKGIVHAATIINDGLINNMATDQLRAVLEPKALGAYNLHELTLETPLDFFILFSSATTLFGNPGQGNYVAANACLDSLAINRRRVGLPATCVRWGAIEDVGYLSRNEKIKDSLQNRMGGSALNSALALEVLEKLLIAGRSGSGVMELDWRKLSRFLPSAESPKFSEIARLAGDFRHDEDDNDNVLLMFEELSEKELLPAVIEILQAEVGEILQIPPERLDPKQSIFDMGLDSLMGVELVVALESRFGAKLPVMTLSQSPTIEKLAERIVLKLKGSSETDETVEEKGILPQVRLVASQHDAEVSSGTIENLVKDLQSQHGFSNDKMIQ